MIDGRVFVPMMTAEAGVTLDKTTGGIDLILEMATTVTDVILIIGFMMKTFQPIIQTTNKKSNVIGLH